VKTRLKAGVEIAADGQEFIIENWKKGGLDEAWRSDCPLKGIVRYCQGQTS